MKAYQFEFATGRTQAAQGSDVWDALKSLGYGRNAMLSIVVTWKQL